MIQYITAMHVCVRLKLLVRSSTQGLGYGVFERKQGTYHTDRADEDIRRGAIVGNNHADEFGCHSNYCNERAGLEKASKLEGCAEGTVTRTHVDIADDTNEGIKATGFERCTYELVETQNREGYRR